MKWVIFLYSFVIHLASYNWDQIFHLPLSSVNDFRTFRAKTITFTLLWISATITPDEMSGFCHHCFTFLILIYIFDSLSSNWILLSLLYFNPLSSCLCYHPCVSEVWFLSFNPLIGFLPLLGSLTLCELGPFLYQPAHQAHGPVRSS